MFDQRAFDELSDSIIDHRYKGIPLGVELSLREVGRQGWNVVRGDLALPVTTLRQSALENNVAVMARYCEEHDLWLAPHGKTTMSPQLFRRQIEAGAWGITAATPTQVAVMRDFGFNRIVLANELVDPAAVRWIASEIEGDDSFEFLCLVDSVAAVDVIDAALDGVLDQRTFSVLIEVGFAGGRGGVRDVDTALALARRIATTRHVRLAGVELFEGVVGHDATEADLDNVDALCALARDAVAVIDREGLFHAEPIIVSAGGSAYFDWVVARLNSWTDVEHRVQFILRSGGYLTHDHGDYERVSPFDGRRATDESPTLVNALEGWANVLSQPDPGFAILGAGKRDLPYDAGLPTPLSAFHRDGSVTDLRGRAKVVKMMDQHSFVEISSAVTLGPTDIVQLGMSHPCTAFDKLRLLPIINDDHVVIDAVLTFF